MVAVLVTFGVLAKHNEVIAFKGCGVSLHRLSVAPGGEQRSEQVLRTTVLLSPNQKVYIGAGGSEKAASGWVLIIQAREAGSG
jgi:hypothetical protein